MRFHCNCYIAPIKCNLSLTGCDYRSNLYRNNAKSYNKYCFYCYFSIIVCSIIHLPHFTDFAFDVHGVVCSSFNFPQPHQNLFKSPYKTKHNKQIQITALVGQNAAFKSPASALIARSFTKRRFFIKNRLIYKS